MHRNWYLVGNGSTGQCIDIVANSEVAACRRLGWSPNDCVVIRVGSGQRRLSAWRTAQRDRHVERRLRSI